MKLGTRVGVVEEAPAKAPEPACEAPEPAQVPAQGEQLSVAVREVLGFPLRLLTDLPLPTTLLCEAADGRRWVVATSGAVLRRAAELGLTALSGAEARVLAVGAEQGRAFDTDLSRWLGRKAADAGYELTVGEVFAGVAERIRPEGWTVEQVLQAVGARLLSVGAGDDQGLQVLAEGVRAA